MIKINGTTIKTPTDLKIERFNLTKSGRVASGDMTMELVAKKVKLTLSYEVISGKEMKQILDLIDTNAMFFDVTYPEVTGTLKTVNCYAGAIPTDKFRTVNPKSNNSWYWKGVNFSLIQR